MDKRSQGIVIFTIEVIAACIQIPSIIMAITGRLFWWQGTLSAILFVACLWLALKVLREVINSNLHPHHKEN